MSFIFLGRIVQAGLALLALRVMTMMLSPEEVGRWSLLLAVTSFFVLGLVNPVGMFINRRLHDWVKYGKIELYMRYYCIYLLSVAFLACVMLYVFNAFYILVPDMSLIWLLSFVVVSIVFATLNQTFTPSLNLLTYRGWFVLLTLATVAVSLCVSFAFVFYLEPNAELWQAGQLTGQVIMAVVGGTLFFVFAKRHQEKFVSHASMRMTQAKLALVFSFVWPLAFSVLFTWVQTQSYRFIVQGSIGLEVLGLFVVGYGVAASLIGIFESIISTYFIPIFYKRVSSGDKREQALAWHEYAKAMLASLCVVISVIISLSDEFAFVLLDKSFANAAQYILWGVAAEAARVTVATYALLAHAGMDTKKLIIPNFLAAIAAPILVFVFVSDWVAHGVGMGLAFAGCIAIVSSHIVLSRSFDIIMPWTQLLRAGLIALGLFFLALFVHGLLGVSGTFVASLAWLVAGSVLLLSTLYMMLKVQINREGI